MQNQMNEAGNFSRGLNYFDPKLSRIPNHKLNEYSKLHDPMNISQNGFKRILSKKNDSSYQATNLNRSLNYYKEEHKSTFVFDNQKGNKKFSLISGISNDKLGNSFRSNINDPLNGFSVTQRHPRNLKANVYSYRSLKRNSFENDNFGSFMELNKRLISDRKIASKIASERDYQFNSQDLNPRMFFYNVQNRNDIMGTMQMNKTNYDDRNFIKSQHNYGFENQIYKRKSNFKRIKTEDNFIPTLSRTTKDESYFGCDCSENCREFIRRQKKRNSFALKKHNENKFNYREILSSIKEKIEQKKKVEGPNLPSFYYNEDPQEPKNKTKLQIIKHTLEASQMLYIKNNMKYSNLFGVLMNLFMLGTVDGQFKNLNNEERELLESLVLRKFKKNIKKE